MEWLKERMEAVQRVKRDERNIAAHADRIYGAVWAAVVDVVKEGPVWGIEMKANGFPLHHTVTAGTHVLKVDLSEDRRRIVGTRPDGKQTVLELAICPDGSVCVRHEEKMVDYAEAAQGLMDAFLFGAGGPYEVKEGR